MMCALCHAAQREEDLLLCEQCRKDMELEDAEMNESGADRCPPRE